MRKTLIPLALLTAVPLEAEDKPALAPSEIVAAAPKADWVGIAPSDLLVMDLAPNAKRKARRVVIQLMPAPFSQGWVGNIRKLAAARFWDGLSVNRVQDNYVVQWGDASEKKPLPEGLAKVAESAYQVDVGRLEVAYRMQQSDDKILAHSEEALIAEDGSKLPVSLSTPNRDVYSTLTGFISGWPAGLVPVGNPESNVIRMQAWPVHCYGMVGVGRNLSPDTGSGAELYTVIGHAPRHLDRNIALVGRVIEGIEHLSSLPRGTGALGFYETAKERVPIKTVRMGDEVAGLPAYEYLSTESESFATYADARANRRDAFFIRPAGGADLCNIPVPVRRAAGK